MRVITEIELREIYKKEPFTSFRIPEDCKLTPAATQFLSERKIEIISKSESQNIPKNIGDKKSKPEHMTHLRGSNLVPKNHPVIRFRGKLDSFQAVLISTILDAESYGYQELSRDLQDLLDYCRLIMKAEVKNEALPQIKIRGWSPQEIRERSHYPKKYYDINHFTPQPRDGRLISGLNYLRTQSRELELAAVEAFYVDDNVEREDILQSLNRFSSLIYIFMAQLLSGYYKVGR